MRQTHKMVKHTPTIRGLLPTNCLSEYDHFVGLQLKGVKSKQESKKAKCIKSLFRKRLKIFRHFELL